MTVRRRVKTRFSLEPRQEPPLAWKKVLLAVALGAMACILTVAAVSWLLDVRVQQYGMDLWVDSRVGFNVANDSLWFGKVMPAGTSSRTITVNNGAAEPRIVSFYFFGDLAQWTYLPTGNRLSLAPGESRAVQVIAKVPEDAQFGHRGGTLFIVFRKQ